MKSEDLIVHVNRVSLARAVRCNEVERAVVAVGAAERIERGEISVTFVEASTITALSRTHLGRAYPTDVLAFNLGDHEVPLGDVYVCPDVARQSAAALGLSLREELLRLVIHGVLHVLGYDHPEGPDREESDMFRRQEEILAGLIGAGP